MSITNKKNPSAKDVLDAISKISSKNNNSAVTVQLPGGPATFKPHNPFIEEDRDPFQDQTQLPITSLQALQLATSMFNAGADREEIGEAITEGKMPKLSEEDIKQTEETWKHYATSLFQTKMKAPEEMSEYQLALAKYLAVQDRPMEARWVGLCVTLPSFRYVDLTKSRLTHMGWSAPEDLEVTEETICKLAPAETYIEKNRNKNVKQYCWMLPRGDEEHQTIINFPVDRENMSNTVAWDNIFKKPLLECRIKGQSRYFLPNFRSIQVQEFVEILN
jgi:hypothetical protein